MIKADFAFISFWIPLLDRNPTNGATVTAAE
jgi:hypothetical protein